MDRLEESLKSALARKEPPDGFAQKVAARAAAPPRAAAWVPQRWLAAGTTRRDGRQARPASAISSRSGGLLVRPGARRT